MSALSIIKALEATLRSVSGALSTVYEGETPTFTIDPATPYQRADTLFGEPLVDELTANRREEGYYQIRLLYPAGVSAGAPLTRAEAIRAAFKRGTSAMSGGVTVHFQNSELGAKRTEGDWDIWPVRVRFYAHLIIT